MTATADVAPHPGTGLAPSKGPGSPALQARPRDRWARVGRRVGLLVMAGLPVAALGVFFCYPVAALLGRGLFGPDGLDLAAAQAVLGRPRFSRTLLFTVGQAAASAVLATLLGLPGAYLLYRCRFRGRAALRAFVTVPFVLPTVVVGLAFRTMFATDGPLGAWGWDGSVAAILAAHVFLNYAVVVRTVGASWAHLDDRPRQAARSLGAGPVRAFCTMTLPALGPSIASAFVLVFLFCATSFGVLLILGGARFGTLETEIYRQTAQIGDLRAAAVLSIVQLLLVTAVLAVSAVLRRRGERTLRWRAAAGNDRPLRRADLPAVAVTALAVVLLLGPMVVLVLRSLRTPSGWSLGNYAALAGTGSGNALLVPVTTALTNSLVSACVAAAFAVVVGLLLAVVLARRPRGGAGRRAVQALDTLVMLPLGVSAVTVGFGFLIALDRPPLDFRSSALLIPIAQAMVATPLVVRMVLPVLRAADDRLRQAAALLGAGPVRVWASVDLPLMSRALIGAVTFAFAVALGEFGATTFVARPDTPTLPVVIGRLIGRPGAENAGMALAAGTVLAVLCAAAVFAVEAVQSFGRRSAATPAASIGGF